MYKKEEKMKPVKYGVILLALLLAAMAMVPMVSAAGAQQDQLSAESIDKAYSPDDYTFTFIGMNITQEKIDQKADGLIQTFNAKYGKTLPNGYQGYASVELSDNDKIAAYGFRILPNGETVTYADIVSSEVNETSLNLAKNQLNEWMTTTLKEKTDAGLRDPPRGRVRVDDNNLEGKNRCRTKTGQFTDPEVDPIHSSDHYILFNQSGLLRNRKGYSGYNMVLG